MRPGRRLGLAWAFALALTLGGCQSARDGPSDTTDTRDGDVVDVVMVGLQHPPVQRVESDIEGTLMHYGQRVRLRRVDIESEAGAELAEDKGLTGHVPLAVFVVGGGQATGSRETRFLGFPKGRAPIPAAEGEWTLDDLRSAVAERVTVSM